MLHLILDIKEGKKVKIVIIGDGKVGHKLTAQLSEEDYDVVLIDQNEGKLKSAIDNLDIFCITGDGANVEIHELVGDDNIYIFQRCHCCERSLIKLTDV